MRLARLISFGTERYPEKVARRLRIVNVGAWSAAILATPLTIVRITDIAHPAFAVGNLLFIALAAAVPLLHRFGPQAALLALIFLFYAFTFRIAFYVGTSDGVWLNFVSGAALTTLLVGAERIRLAAGVAVLSVGLVVLLHMVVPKDTVLMASRLSPFAKLTANVAANTVILVLIVFYAVRQFERAEAAAEREHARSESLLLSILPATVAERLKGPHKPFIADKYEEASILFADMAGHTALASEMSPEEVVRFLNRVFTQFDDLVEKHGLEKIKTAGDGYVVVSGVPTPLTTMLGRSPNLRWSCAKRPPGSAIRVVVPSRFASAFPAARSWRASSAQRRSSTMSGAMPLTLPREWNRQVWWV